MFEDFLNALQNFRRNKTRTILSLLGVIIGVASVIMITSMGSSSTQQVKETFGSAGLDMVQMNAGFMRRKAAAASIQFNDTFRETLFEKVEHIKKIWYKNSLSGTVSFGETSSTTTCSAVEAGYIDTFGLSFEYGKSFTVTDDVEGVQKIILGSTIADALFPAKDGEGKTVILTTDKISFCFVVAGVLKEQTSGMEQTASAVYIPRGFYAKKIKPNPDAQTVLVQVDNPSYATSMVNELKNYCQKITGSEYSVSVMSMQSMIEQMDSITSMMSLLLSAIAGISLLVGGIGIMNIMIVTVTERKQEIGIRKALGASPADIRRQFLVESASITLIGGMLGIFLGIAISFAVQYVKSTAFVISVPACMIAFLFSVFVGIVFGLSPAARAAKLDPVLALAGE